jgi:hypothetical protein
VRRHAQRALAALALLWAAFAGTPALADAEDCPDVGLVPELTRMTKFKDGKGRTIDDIQYDIVVQSTSQPVCREKDRRVYVSLQLAFAAQRAKAEAGGRIEFSYFVAIRHRVTGAIVAKEVFPVGAAWPQGRTSAVLEEELEQVTIPIRKDEKPIYYAILVGLQLSEDQLAYNRQRRGEVPGARPAGAPGAPPAGLPMLPGMAPAGAAPPASAPQLPGMAPTGAATAPPGAPALPGSGAQPALPTLPTQSN